VSSDEPTSLSTPNLSLRWKALIGLTIVLVGVNASLAAFAYRQLVDQFESQQVLVRDRQAKQLRALLDDRYQQMSRLANVVPLLVPEREGEDLDRHLRRALDTNGVMLDLEWDIRSVHWIRVDGQVQLLWPTQAVPLPSALVAEAEQIADDTARLLVCEEECRQLLAAPLLWHGSASGALVLGRSVADALLAFNTLTGAEVAISPSAHWLESVGAGSQTTSFKAITHPEYTRSLFDRAVNWSQDPIGPRPSPLAAMQFASDREWYEVFRLPGIAAGIDALILNNVTSQRKAIASAIAKSILIGIVGLALSEGLVLLIMRRPLSRLRRLATLLPLLAEQRFSELRARLPRNVRRLPFEDEMDLIVDTVDSLSTRMETMERDREEARGELIWLADHDSLTGLLNRRGFNQKLVHAVEEAAARGRQGALLFVDLDQFKDVNDISGHPMGDTLLERIAEQLAEGTSGKGILGRLGGDEFAIILPDSDPERAITLAAQLQDRIQQVILHSRSWRHQVSASIGIVLYPEHGTEVQQLMADADLAMYQAKEKGRGRWHLFSPEDQGRERANARVIWAERIAEALNEDRYELHFQPIMELATGKVWRAEALLRMRDPHGELVLPFSFIPIAEETGQIQALDHWVLAHAVALMEHHRSLCLSVNLSANALQDPSLLPDIERLLKHHRVRPSDLTFEITETVAINSLRNATRLMREIQAIGCRFALDDFGSGFASYAYLRQLPVDDVKIDGAFIRDIAFSREDQIFVRAVTEMAHGMGKRVVAEFVENEEIVEVLRDIGVDFAQGYHIGRPAMPAADRSRPDSESVDAASGPASGIANSR